MNFSSLLATAPRSSMRRAALMVHGLPTADRNWLLTQLPTSERERLQSLLAELTVLAIPADRRELDAFLGELSDESLFSPAASLAGTGSLPQMAKNDDDAAQRAALSQLNSESVAGKLKDEPDGLIVQLLGLTDRPWKLALLARLDSHHRDRIEAGLVRAQLTKLAINPHRLTRSLIQSLGQVSGESDERATVLAPQRPHTDAKPQPSAGQARSFLKSLPWRGRNLV